MVLLLYYVVVRDYYTINFNNPLLSQLATDHYTDEQ